MARLTLAFTLILIIISSFLLWSEKNAPAPVAAEGKPAIGGPFSLTNQDGKTVTDKDFRGKILLVYFGFTHCPDQCPLTLANFTQVMNALGSKAGQVAPLFISVDPAHDTPKRMKEFLAAFSPAITGLTGTNAQVADVAVAYKVYYAAHDTKHASESAVDHSGFIYVMDREGNYLTHFSADTTPKQIETSLRPYLQ